MKKFRVNFLFVIFVVIAIMIGLSKELLAILLCFTIHEFGHLLFIILFKYKVNNFNLYPFGGVISYQEKNDFIYKELLIMTGGIVFNLIFVLVFHLLNLTLLSKTNMYFVILNSLPVNPLDGGRILIIFLSLFLPNKLSKTIVYCFSIFVVILMLFLLKVDGVYLYFIILLILKENILNLLKVKEEYNKFLLIKHLNTNRKLRDKITKFWTFDPIDSLFRGRNMIFDYETFKISEEELLKKHFKIKKDY